MKKIILIGAGGHAKSCIDVIENSTDNLKIFGLIEKNKNNKKFFNYKIVGTEDDLKKIKKYCEKFIKKSHYLRPKFLSGDKSLVVDAVFHALKCFQKKNKLPKDVAQGYKNVNGYSVQI